MLCRYIYCIYSVYIYCNVTSSKGVLFLIVHARTSHECTPEDWGKSVLLAWKQRFPAGSQAAMSFNSEATIYITAEPYNLQTSTVAVHLQTFDTPGK